MNLQPRIDSINDELRDKYTVAIASGGLEPFERLLDGIERDIAKYRQYMERS